MIRLYLIRHAADEKRGGMRRLTPRGRRRFRLAARAFADLGEPVDRICASPKPHARQTASLLAAALRHDEVVELDELSPRVSPRRLLRALAALGGDSNGLALVGHKGQLRKLLATLGLRKRELPLRKGSMLRVDLDALPEPRLCIPRFRVRPAAGQIEDAFVGLRRVG